MISGWTYPVTFICCLIALLLGAALKTNCFAYLAIVAFVIWDIIYLVRPSFFAGRDANQILSQVITARTYISYFIPIYGVILGLLLTMENEQLTVLVKLIADSGLRLELLVLPFLLSTVALLLFPVQMTNNQTSQQKP